MIERVCRAVLITLLSLSSVHTVGANPPASQSARTTLDQTATESTALTATERAKAEVWGLSVAEWRRYRALMAGVRGSLSPATLSPIEVLGIHARDEAERRRYAEQWAVMMREDAMRILAFQHAYDQAGRRLYPGVPLIDLARLPGRPKDDPPLRATDRVLLFARPDCVACDALLERLLARLDRIAGLDVYLSGVQTGDEAAIRDWATAREIQPEWVRTGKVTLNFEAGVLARLAPKQGELPYLMRRRAGSPNILDFRVRVLDNPAVPAGGW